MENTKCHEANAARMFVWKAVKPERIGEDVRNKHIASVRRMLAPALCGEPFVET